MSDLLNKLGSVFEANPELQKRFEEAESAEEMYDLVKDYLDGISFEDFVREFEKMSEKEEKGTGELSLDDLDDVSGGALNLKCPSWLKKGWDKVVKPVVGAAVTTAVTSYAVSGDAKAAGKAAGKTLLDGFIKSL